MIRDFLPLPSALSAAVLVASAPGCSSGDTLDSIRSAAPAKSSALDGAPAKSGGSSSAASGAGGSGAGGSDGGCPSTTTTGAGGADTTVTSCPTASMDAIYTGYWPPNPYGEKPPATDCVAAEHDVLIVLGCPNNADGTPSFCQTKRADMAVSLMSAGYGQRFIVSGGAVHNAYVEADTLKALLLARGVPDGSVFTETKAQHTDENIYYSTQIMLMHGWTNALVISDNPGHLMMTALCDSNCCVDLGRLTLFDFPVAKGATLFAGHYALYPWGREVSKAECDTIELPTKLMCVNLASRKACALDFQLPP